MVQTGANNLSGGVHFGKSIFLYHPPVLVALTTMGVPLAPPSTCSNAQVMGEASKRDEDGVDMDLVGEEEKEAMG